MLFCYSITNKDELRYTKLLKAFSSTLTKNPDDKIAMAVIKFYG